MKSLGNSVDLHIALAIVAAASGFVALLFIVELPKEALRGLALSAGGAMVGVAVATGALKVRQHFARSSRLRELKRKPGRGPDSSEFTRNCLLMTYHKEDDLFVEQVTKYLSIFDFEVNFDRSGEIGSYSLSAARPLEESLVFIASEHSCRSNSLMAGFHEAIHSFENVLVVRLNAECFKGSDLNFPIIDVGSDFDEFGHSLRAALAARDRKRSANAEAVSAASPI